MVDNRTARICQCQEQKHIQKLFGSSRITPAFRNKTFENYEIDGKNKIIETMYDAAQEYIKNYQNSWLVLLGEPGCGKSHLSIAAGNYFLSKGMATLYFQHIEGMNELKESLRAEEGIKSKVSQMKEVEFLIWDDLFKKKEVKPFELEIVFEVLNYRYLNLLPTAINSERSPNELMQIDKAIGSRILERGKGFTVVVSGTENNYRLR